MKDFTLQEKHDYNLVIYRENHNKKFFLKSITTTLILCFICEVSDTFAI